MSETLFTFLFTAALLCLVRRTTNDGPRSNVQASVGGRWPAVVAGTLFGLATLTRSITLLFVPVVALWLLSRAANSEQRTKIGPTRSAVLCSLLFVLCSTLAIVPWTIRNYVAYGRIIPVETGLSYNLWAFNEPRERQSTIFRTLERIPNPAERSDYATAKGLARLREDPAILLRKLWPNWIYLWRVKPIEDRFLQENYYGDVGLPSFAAALVFDDALYLVIVLAGVAGLALFRRSTTDHRCSNVQTFKRSNVQQALQNPKSLVVAWLVYVIATMLLTHGEARYRHFLFPVLIPYAAWALTRIADCGLQIADWGTARSKIQNPKSKIVMVALWALIGGVALVYYPWGWAAQSVARGWQAAAANLAWAMGDRAVALHADERALDVQETADGWVRLGDHARATGDERRALKAYREAMGMVPSYVPAAARLGDLLRATGDEPGARSAFDAPKIDRQWLTDWSWRELRPEPKESLAVGDGLDFGYVSGMYPAEQQQGALARWTDGRGRLRLRADGTRALLRLRLAAPHPGGAPVAVQICVAGRCVPLEVGPTWRTYLLPLDITAGQNQTVEVRSDTFDVPDGRRLGVLIDLAEVLAAEDR